MAESMPDQNTNDSDDSAATTTPPAEPVRVAGHQLSGTISYYGQAFKGKRTACGTLFNPKEFTMAHKTLPCGTLVRVTNLRNGRTTEVQVTDHGPNIPGRVADLSTAAAAQMGLLQQGITQGKLEVLKMGAASSRRKPKARQKRR